ncbi:MAG: hypothetical protein AAGB12_12855 [Pseudomonadota bacterium]
MITKKMVLPLVAASLINMAYANNDPYSGQIPGDSEVCESNINLGEALSSSWTTPCLSDNRNSYSDPYAPPTTYYAHYFTFTLDEDSDVAIKLDDNQWDSRFYLLDGERGSAIIRSDYSQLESFLRAGTYTIEVTNSFIADFSLSVAQVNQGTGECIFSIQDNQTLQGEFTTDCLSVNRASGNSGNSDPYNFRAKYYTFELLETSDIKFSLSSSSDIYQYLLTGNGENGDVLKSLYFNDRYSNQPLIESLNPGEFTVEIASANSGEAGQFSISYEIIGENTECIKKLNLNSTLNEEFSPQCLRQEEFSNLDPYAGTSLDPVRANYYELLVDETTALNLSVNSDNITPLITLYSSNGEPLHTNEDINCWGCTPSNELSVTLDSGEYLIEISAYNTLAIGQYRLTSLKFSGANCTNEIKLGDRLDSLLDNRCLSIFRGDGTGNSDPYSGNNDPYGPTTDTYFAKRFEFDVSEPSSIRLSTSLSNYSGFIYLAKKESVGYSVLNQTQDYWGIRSESFDRHLDLGSYVAEITTAYPETEAEFSVSLNTLGYQACESFVNVSEPQAIELGTNSGCLSQQKPPVYHYDPYGPLPSYYDYFYASYNTFKVETAGSYVITLSDSGTSTELFLLEGSNQNGVLLDRSFGNSLLITLQPGYYTVESTTVSPNVATTGNLLVEKLN